MTNEYESLKAQIVKIRPPFINRIFGNNSTLITHDPKLNDMERYVLFTDKEKNEIMINLASNIEKYVKQKRKVKLNYSKKTHNNGFEEIKEININSEDGIINGKIKYLPEEKRFICGMISLTGDAWAFTPDSIYTNLNFNSNNPADKEEYLGLAKIIKEM